MNIIKLFRDLIEMEFYSSEYNEGDFLLDVKGFLRGESPKNFDNLDN